MEARDTVIALHYFIGPLTIISLSALSDSLFSIIYLKTVKICGEENTFLNCIILFY